MLNFTIMRWISIALLTALLSRAQPPVDQPAPRPPVVDSLPLPAPRPRAPDYDTTRWTDIALADTAIMLDLKYATADNFVETQLYDCPRCLLRPEVARALIAAHRELQAMGYRLKMFDCYRPLPIQWKLWEKMPDRRYVADPRKGSMHNRGAAVDLTLVYLDGVEFDMGTPFDFFGKKAYHAYTNLPKAVLDRRKLLKATMEKHGFKATSTEWWHYAYIRKNYPLSDYMWECR